MKMAKQYFFLFFLKKIYNFKYESIKRLKTLIIKEKNRRSVLNIKQIIENLHLSTNLSTLNYSNDRIMKIQEIILNEEEDEEKVFLFIQTYFFNN